MNIRRRGDEGIHDRHAPPLRFICRGNHSPAFGHGDAEGKQIVTEIVPEIIGQPMAQFGFAPPFGQTFETA